TGSTTCFAPELWRTISGRAADRPPGSYTAELLDDGVGACARKVGEEAVELAVAALDESDERVVEEAADLVYHLYVLLAARRLDGTQSHETVVRALTVLANMEHRGAAGADADTGDGAGILTQLPDAFLRDAVDFELPPLGGYGVGVCFLPRLAERRRQLERLLEEAVAAEGLTVRGWRCVPVRAADAGRQAQLFPRVIRQLVVRG